MTWLRPFLQCNSFFRFMCGNFLQLKYESYFVTTAFRPHFTLSGEATFPTFRKRLDQKPLASCRPTATVAYQLSNYRISSHAIPLSHLASTSLRNSFLLVKGPMFLLPIWFRSEPLFPFVPGLSAPFTVDRAGYPTPSALIGFFHML